MILNEYEDLLIECMEVPIGKMNHCDPLGDFNSPQTLTQSITYLALVIVACMAISLGIMKVLSKRSH